MLALDYRASESFVFSSLLTGATFLGIGILQGRVAGRRTLVAGLETLALGGAAASVAFIVGRLLERLAVAQ
jgi:VIT1/CCC1 family predicted Fe2+/Mn2+ transporter